MLQAHAQEFLKRGGGRILDCWGIFEISYLSPCKIRFQLIFSVERVETQVRGGGGVVSQGACPTPQFSLLLVANYAPPPPGIFVIVSCKLVDSGRCCWGKCLALWSCDPLEPPPPHPKKKLSACTVGPSSTTLAQH